MISIDASILVAVAAVITVSVLPDTRCADDARRG